MKAAGLLFEEDFQYIDHIAPFCSYFGFPLIVTEPSTEELCQKYYPDTTVSLQEIANLPYFLKSFTRVYYCFTSQILDRYLGHPPLFPEVFLERIWIPHGFSEKDNYEGLFQETDILVYGNAMKNRIKKKKLSGSCHFFANIRLLYFLKNLSFYRTLVETLLSSLNPSFPTFLYAPTWEDSFSSFSFSEAQKLLENFPQEANLIIQFHPNTQRKRAFEIELLKASYLSSRFLFLENFYPIYPLLDKVDAYIGNASSVHYDALFFVEKPLFFLNKKPLHIHKVGEVLQEKDIPFIEKKYEITKKTQALFPIKKKFYFSTFL